MKDKPRRVDPSIAPIILQSSTSLYPSFRENHVIYHVTRLRLVGARTSLLSLDNNAQGCVSGCPKMVSRNNTPRLLATNFTEPLHTNVYVEHKADSPNSYTKFSLKIQCLSSVYGEIAPAFFISPSCCGSPAELTLKQIGNCPTQTSYQLRPDCFTVRSTSSSLLFAIKALFRVPKARTWKGRRKNTNTRID